MIAAETRRGPRNAAEAALAPDLLLVKGFAEQWRPRIEGTLATQALPTSPAIEGMLEATAAATGIGGAGGGHRWRPLLTLAAVEACGADPALGLRSACAVELTHTASLVLDDLPCMDDSPLRRGLPATHVRVGTAGAILIAVGLLGRAAELLGQDRAAGAEACRTWGQVLGFAGMAGGQGVDLDRVRPFTGAARRLHRQKTTALSAFSLGVGAQIAGAGAATRFALERFGRDLGWAYQVADDVADAHEDERVGRRKIRRLMGRAEITVREAPGLTTGGRNLLLGFGRTLVAMVC